MSKTAFSTVIKSITDKQIDLARDTLTNAYDRRAEFQRAKDPTNEKIQDALKASHKALSSDEALKVMLACDADLEFINRSTNEGTRYNVYAANKLADLVATMSTGVFGNAINNAVTRSLFAFDKAKEKFTGEMARAAVSDKIRIQGQIAKLLVRHTVSAATAPTQMSSTMTALGTLGIVSNGGTKREPVFTLTDTPQAKRLGDIVAKAA